MINTNKRRTLKTLAAATTVALAPAMTNATNSNRAAESIRCSDGTGLQLNFKKNAADQIVTISNTSGSPITVKHVYPGIVQADGKNYDVNSLLKRDRLTIGAYSSVDLTINPTAQATEQPLPDGFTFNKPLSVSTQVETSIGTTPVTTLRNYIA